MDTSPEKVAVYLLNIFSTVMGRSGDKAFSSNREHCKNLSTPFKTTEHQVHVSNCVLGGGGVAWKDLWILVQKQHFVSQVPKILGDFVPTIKVRKWRQLLLFSFSFCFLFPFAFFLVGGEEGVEGYNNLIVLVDFQHHHYLTIPKTKRTENWQAFQK